MNDKPMKRELENIAQRGVPGDINLWPEISARLERKPTMRHYLPRPFAAVLIAALGLIVLSGAAFALGRALGYIPGAGLVENPAGIRVLAEPVTMTRDGVTLTVESVIATDDRVDVVYDVKGLAPENDAAQSTDAPSEFCGGASIGSAPGRAGDARLQLPDGSVLERDRSGQYAQNAFAMKPVYAASIPAGVSQMTLLLDCIPQARLGAAPENWAVPLALKAVPAGQVVGAPVIEVEPKAAQPAEAAPAQPADQAAAIPAPAVTMQLTKIVPLEQRTIFYFSLNVADPDPSLISIMPAGVSVIDSQGQKIPLIGNFPWQPFEHRLGSEFEYTSQAKPADGPLTLVVEDAVAYYAPMYADTPQATPEEMSFSFDAGAAPQYGQTWTIDKSFDIAGYPIRVLSARAASFSDIQTPDFIDGSQGYDAGYDFLVETDPSVKFQVEMDVAPDSPACGLTNPAPLAPESSSIHYVQLCRGGYPTGDVRVTIRELAVLVDNTWQATWTP